MAENYRDKFIKANLTKLIKCTNVDQLVDHLYEKDLIDDSEMNIWRSDPDRTKTAGLLYTNTCSRWNTSQFQSFLDVLKTTNHLRALEVFTCEGGPYFLKQDIFKELLEQSKKGTDGVYEGISFQYEKDAKEFVKCANRLKTEDDKHYTFKGRLNHELLNKVHQALKDNRIWWNKRKQSLRDDYIKRKLRQIDDEESGISRGPELSWNDLNEKFLVLVDGPGMGKSTEISYLEKTLRRKINSNRIIVRVNLNERTEELEKLQEGNTENYLAKLAPHVPFKNYKIEDQIFAPDLLPTNLTEAPDFLPKHFKFERTKSAKLTYRAPQEDCKLQKIKTFLLLDGLDEVCPNYKEIMLKLLQKLKSSKITVYVTVRSYLKDVIVKELNIKCWSIQPLTTRQQNKYLKKKLQVSYDEIEDMLSKQPASMNDLLKIPLNLYMFANIMQNSDTGFCAKTLNSFDLYTYFVNEEHNVYLTEKFGMKRRKSTISERQTLSMLKQNLPYYYYIALCELRGELIKYYKADLAKTDLNKIAWHPDEETAKELLQYGLIVMGATETNRLQFKHRSFAEFFYAKLILDPKCSQGVRDILFGFVYRPENVLRNVSEFIASGNSIKECLTLTGSWLANCFYNQFNERCGVLEGFLVSCDEHLIQAVVLSFVNGDPAVLKQAFRVLANCEDNNHVLVIYNWMIQNEDWTHSVLFERGRTKSTLKSGILSRLILVIFLLIEDQTLFSENEIKSAINSCDLLYTVAVIKLRLPSIKKWDRIEKFSGEQVNMKQILMKCKSSDFSRIFQDMDTIWKLFESFTQSELVSLLVTDERITDIIMYHPLRCETAVGLGTAVTKGTIANLRGKFQENKNKTVFVTNEFAIDYFWNNLENEFQEKNHMGPVTRALRDTITNFPSLGFFESIERAMLYHERSCNNSSSTTVFDINPLAIEYLWNNLTKEFEKKNPTDPGITAFRTKFAKDPSVDVCDSIEEDLLCKGNCKNASLLNLKNLIDWIVDEGRIWDKVLSFPLTILPYLMIHFGSSDNVKTFIEQNFTTQFENTHPLFLLSFIVVGSHPLKRDNTDCYTDIVEFVQRNAILFENGYENLYFVLQAFEKAQIRDILPLPLLNYLVSATQIITELLTKYPNTSFNSCLTNSDFIEMACEIIEYSPYCDIFSSMMKLKTLIIHGTCKDIFLSQTVLFGWHHRFSAEFRGKFSNYKCGLKGLLKFYLECFGPFKDWITGGDSTSWYLAVGLVAEIITCLEETDNLKHHIPSYVTLVKKTIEYYNVRICNFKFFYQTNEEWLKIVKIVDISFFVTTKEASRPFEIPSSIAVPLILTLISEFGKTNAKALLRGYWSRVSLQKKFRGDTLETNGTLLHLAIELDELEQVQRHCWPGLILWKNSEGKDALSVAKDSLETKNPIIAHIENCYKKL